MATIQKKIEILCRKPESENGNGDILKPFFVFWKEQDLPKHKTGVGIGSLQKSIKYLRRLIMGNLYNDRFDYESYHNRGFSLEEFKLSVRRYARSFSGEFKASKPKNVKPQVIWSFLLPVRGASQFLFYLENEPRTQRKDIFPSLTNAIIKTYCKEVLGGTYFEPSAREMEQFVLTSIRLSNFLKKNRRLISPYIDLNDHNFKSLLLIESIRQDISWRKLPMSVGFLCSDITFHQRLPAYLKAQGVLVQEGQSEFNRLNSMSTTQNNL